MRTITSLFSEKKGSVIVQTAAIVIMIMLPFSVVYQFGRVLIIASGTHDAVRNSIISTVSENYYNSFDGMREGNSGAYIRDNSGNWQGIVNSGTAVQSLIQTLQLKNSDNGLQSISDTGSLNYGISDLSISVKNAELRSNSIKLSVYAAYILDVPVDFFLIKFQLHLPMTVNAKFEQLF